ncbi:MAG: MFS transporter [Polyangiales bacterium]
MRAALRQLPPEVWALGAVSLLTDAASDMIYPLLPQLLLLVGGGAVALGTLEGTAELVSSLVKAWAGRAADKGGKHGRYVIAGYALASVSRPCLALISAPWQAVFFRSLDRLGKGIRSAPRDTILARVTPPERRGLAFGVHQGMDNLGAVVGPLLAWLLLSGAHLDVRTVIALAIVPGIFATIAATWAVRKETDAPPAEIDVDAPKAEVPNSVRRLLAVTAIFALGASADSFLLMQLQGLGLPIAWIPIAWVTLQLGKSLLNVPGGALADRLGPRRVLLGSWFIYAIAYAAFAFAPSWPIFWAIFAVYAFHYGLGEGAEKSLITSMAPKGARGTAFGLQHAVHGFALLPANVLFGLLYKKKPWIAFTFSASLAFVAAIALLVLTTDSERVRQSA